MSRTGHGIDIILSRSLSLSLTDTLILHSRPLPLSPHFLSLHLAFTFFISFRDRLILHTYTLFTLHAASSALLPSLNNLKQPHFRITHFQQNDTKSSNMYSTLISVVFTVLLAKQAVAGYALEDDYNSNNWLSMFNFFTAPDPTHGK
jgi:hypothetical protein